MKYYLGLFLSFLLMLGFPSLAFADVGIPMIVYTWPAMILALIPVVLIEAYVISDLLRVGFKKTVIPSSVANIVTTVVGIPLSWGLLFVFGLLIMLFGSSFDISSIRQGIVSVLVIASWVAPMGGQTFWFTFYSLVTSFVVAFLVSVLMEYWILRLFFRGADKKLVKKTVWIANAASYALLIVSSLILFYFFLD
ncbi:MAG: hypothetical protein Q8P73_04825 [bacterium]|nr:hypothetical protein [bacterium]